MKKCSMRSFVSGKQNKCYQTAKNFIFILHALLAKKCDIYNEESKKYDAIETKKSQESEN